MRVAHGKPPQNHSFLNVYLISHLSDQTGAKTGRRSKMCFWGGKARPRQLRSGITPCASSDKFRQVARSPPGTQGEFGQVPDQWRTTASVSIAATKVFAGLKLEKATIASSKPPPFHDNHCHELQKLCTTSRSNSVLLRIPKRKCEF